MQKYRLDKPTAEDVASDVFLRFFQRSRKLQVTGTIRNYLMSMARSVVADRYERRKAAETGLFADTPSSGPSAHAVMEQAEIAEQVAQAVDSLAESHRLALELRQAGFSHKQIAAIANCTEKASRRRAEKARAQLRLSLSRCGSSCVMGTPLQEHCPARERDLFCLKRLYLNSLRAT